MTNFFKRLFCINNAFNISYACNVEQGIFRLTNAKNKHALATVCLLERNTYWQAERQYQDISLFDLPKIIKAELRHIAPFPSQVFWKIQHLSWSSAKLVYYAVPLTMAKLISEQCQFVYPIGDIPAAQSVIPEKSVLIKDGSGLLVNFSSFVDKPEDVHQYVGVIGEQNVFSLAGFRTAKDEVIVKQRLSMKKLAIFCSISLLLFTGLSSVYLGFTLKYYQSEVANNSVAVEQALNSQRELKEIVASKQEFDVFSQENKNVLAILSSFSFKDEKYRIERIHLHPEGVSIRGTSETSATNLLTILSKHPMVSSAKFSRPVSKNRQGEDIFVIEVLFL